MSSNVGRYLPANYSASNPINVDTGLGWEYIRIINNSPYLLSVSMGGAGTFDFPEMYLEDIKLISGYNGKITIIPFANFPPAAISSALSSLITINVYQPGEIRQPQAQPLTTMSAIGGGNFTPVTQVFQVGQPDPTSVVAATPSPSFVGASLEAILNNDGSFHFGDVNVIAGLACYADNNGNLNVHTINVFVGGTFGGPIVLATGIQETGNGAIDVTATAGGQTFGTAVNFKMVMTNTPSSITIVSIVNTNTTAAPAVDHIDQYGFHCTVTSNNAGRMFYLFTYTTVGN